MIRFVLWLREEGRIRGVFDNLRNFLICGTIAYVSLHIILVSGEGLPGTLDRVFGWIVLSCALVLMVLNLADGYLGIRDSLGTGLSVLITVLYVLLAGYVVFTLATAKLHAPHAASKMAERLPFSLFR